MINSNITCYRVASIRDYKFGVLWRMPSLNIGFNTTYCAVDSTGWFTIKARIII